MPRTSGAGSICWEKWDALIGKESDSSLARRIGCSRQAVRNRRSQVHKPPFLTFNFGATELKVRLQKRTVDRLKRDARTAGVSMSLLVRQIVEQWEKNK